LQRGLAEEEHVSSRKAIEDAGCQIVEIGPREHGKFVEAVQPMLKEARGEYGAEMFGLVPKA
jgi:TRAP-type C4-dicarboxylate transport system substrate-binding protein